MKKLDICQKQNSGNSSGFGDRLALLIVDFVNGFADPNQFGGGILGGPITATAALLASARKAKIPIAFTRVVYADDGSDAGVFCDKAPGLKNLTEHSEPGQVVNALAPAGGEYVLRKTKPSALLGTNFAAWLVSRQVGALLVTGCTTSGRVRASVANSMSCNFRTVCVTDCICDRALKPHEANIFDMGQKNADLVSRGGGGSYLAGVASGQSSFRILRAFSSRPAPGLVPAIHAAHRNGTSEPGKRLSGRSDCGTRPRLTYAGPVGQLAPTASRQEERWTRSRHS